MCIVEFLVKSKESEMRFILVSLFISVHVSWEISVR